MSENVIRFHISESQLDELTWGEWEALEMVAHGFGGATQTRIIMIRFMVDEDGKPMSKEKASKQLRRLKYADAKDDLVEKFAEQFREAVLPKANGSKS